MPKGVGGLGLRNIKTVAALVKRVYRLCDSNASMYSDGIEKRYIKNQVLWKGSRNLTM